MQNKSHESYPPNKSMPNQPFDPSSNGLGFNTPSTSSLTGAAVAARTGVSREVHSFLADIEDLIVSTTSLTGEDLARAKAKLAERVAAAKQSVEEMGGVIADRARKTATATDQYVHAKPWKAVGISAAVGLLIGLLLAPRRA